MAKFLKTFIQKQAIKLFNTPGVKEFLLLGGSRSGKTFIIIYTILVIASKFPGSRHLIARFRFNSVKGSIWLDTLPKVLKICFPGLVTSKNWNNQDYFLRLPNGSEIWIAGLDDKDRVEKVLGKEYLTIFLNECSQISYESYTTVKTRLAQLIPGARQMLFLDENPPSKKHWTYKIWLGNLEPDENTKLDASRYAWLRMNPEHNLANIAKDYIQTLKSMSKRKQRRFLLGEFSDDSEGALWTDKLLNSTRVTEAPVMRRIVVSIDPSVTSKDTSDDCGLTVIGIDYYGEGYLLEDATDIMSPTQWAKRSIKLLKKWKADLIVGEVNNGGDLIETVLRGIDDNIPYKSVHATRDKLTRAEPVQALYEQGKMHHVGEHTEMELEMTTTEFKKGEKSPNRIDSLVWGVTELMLDETFELWEG